MVLVMACPFRGLAGLVASADGLYCNACARMSIAYFPLAFPCLLAHRARAALRAPAVRSAVGVLAQRILARSAAALMALTVCLERTHARFGYVQSAVRAAGHFASGQRLDQTSGRPSPAHPQPAAVQRAAQDGHAAQVERLTAASAGSAGRGTGGGAGVPRSVGSQTSLPSARSTRRPMPPTIVISGVVGSAPRSRSRAARPSGR